MLPVFLEIPGYRVILLWTATQAQRDHKIFQTGNFRVQPHATMGSSIVDYVVRTLTGRLADVGDVGWYGLPTCKVLALLKDYVSVIRFSNTMQCEKTNGGD